ncbi:hypothetical protein [Streptomyces corynorhini]|uniref:hypothetical protein n=1 Tax=Streptomyces corynorhini TaxID=2282652 RepID=UPI001F187FC4|nr:hypothetical protein [Streptomyces corynorhini]
MAYAEKRGSGKRPWRARYKKPDGTKGSEPGFRTKVAAEDWGEDQEAEIRAGTWIDPDLMRVHFGVFARKFMAERQKRGRTNGTRWDRLDAYILPKWEHTPLIGMTWFDVDSWQMLLPCEDVTRGHCVSLMSTILTAAVDARHLKVNPLYGRRRTAAVVSTPTIVKPRRSDEDGAHSPEDVLRVADRMGPAKGLNVITTAFTGINWGEGQGLHRDACLRTRRQRWGSGWFECPTLRVVQEVAEYEERGPAGEKLGTVLRLEPTKNEWRERDLDLPPFLERMWRYHLADWPYEWVLSTESGKWWRRSNWGKQIRPAADGRSAREKRQGVSARKKWEPIAPGMTMRSLRHLHDSLQAQIGVKAPLEFEQAGHKRPGIKGVYQHPTPEMRQERLDGLEEIFWGAMRNLGWTTLWGRVDLVKHTENHDRLPSDSQLIYMEDRSRTRDRHQSRSEAV